MNRRFRLTTVERLRSAGLDRAAHDLAAARRRVDTAQATLDGLRSAIDDCLPPQPATPDQAIAAAHRRDSLRDKAERVAGEVAACHDDAARALIAWHASRSDLRAVEALHERHRLAVAADDARREQQLTDELAGALLAFPAAGARGARPGPWPGGDAA